MENNWRSKRAITNVKESPLKEMNSVENSNRLESSLSKFTNSIPLDEQRTVRERRYKREETKLHRNLRAISKETSPEELKIRALESATARLSDIAGEANQRLHQLRHRLSQTDQDAANYETLKRQRWIEEHRASLAYSEERAVKERLAGLLRTVNSSSSSSSASTENSQINHVTAKKQTNLVRFLQDSPTKRPLHPSFSMNDQRRSTVSDVASHRPSSYTWLSRSRVDAPLGSGHSRSKSLNTAQPVDEYTETPDAARGTRPLRLRATQSFQRPTLKAINELPSHTENTLFNLNAPPVDDKLSKVDLMPDNQTTLVAPSTVSLRSFAETSSTSIHGHASILPAPAPRSPNDILAGLGEVPMPAYAINLIDSFVESVAPAVHLSPHIPRKQSDTESISSGTFPKVQNTSHVTRRFSNRRSIFSVQLPRKSLSANVPPSVFQNRQNKLTPLTPSPNSSRISEEEFSSLELGDSARREGLRRAKFLRSTRDKDLAQLDPAPDDVDVDWIHLPLPVELPTVVNQSGNDQLQMRASSFRESMYSSPIVNKIRQRFSLLSRS